jgi:hypothetical protein
MLEIRSWIAMVFFFARGWFSGAMMTISSSAIGSAENVSSRMVPSTMPASILPSRRSRRTPEVLETERSIRMSGLAMEKSKTS